ncbi:hypothetical protein PR048_007591 [Dryococelus australis]|uniref:Uncharacterized protein n=1 Tax=Dryococelus australis TaxID=614101 RepID=A0ABQ9HUN0_9NEOP|nr:hypothetical protein PR048_007591 [Dryococelus australis]
METQHDPRRGKKTQLRLNARRKKNKTIKGRKRRMIGNKMVYLKENDSRMKLLCADNIQDADMELSAGIGDTPRTIFKKTPEGIGAYDVYVATIPASHQSDPELNLKTNSFFGSFEIRQRNLSLWIAERSKRITASNFGEIGRFRPTTSREKSHICVIQRFLRMRSDQPTNHLQSHHFRNSWKSKSSLLAYCVDPDLPWRAATPDDLVGTYALAEVNCPVTARNLSPQEAIEEKKLTYCILKAEGKSSVQVPSVRAPSHFARQILLFCTTESEGNIRKNETLVNFFMECLFQEIIDPRYTRGMAIGERPQFLYCIKRKQSGDLSIK